MVKDPNNNATTYYYDVYGRVTKVVYAQSNAFQQTWTADSHVASSIDAKNQTTTFGYDSNSENLQPATPELE